jgi:hypothetical protein
MTSYSQGQATNQSSCVGKSRHTAKRPKTLGQVFKTMGHVQRVSGTGLHNVERWEESLANTGRGDHSYATLTRQYRRGIQSGWLGD